MKKAFVIGHPINHSKSPVLHGHWLAEHSLDGSYQALDIEPSMLGDFAKSLKAGSFVGGNVTVPHKEKIMPFCDHLSDTAKTIGAVNTLWVQDGALYGDNTDKYGFLANLDQQDPTWGQHSGTAIVLGAGGAARAILVGLVERNYQRIFVLNRTVERAQNLSDDLNEALSTNVLQAGTLAQFNEHAQNADLLVNTSAVGMNNTRFDGLELSRLPKHAIVTDIVYTPLCTPLLEDAEKLGLKAIDGLGMLLHQAVPGFERWFGVRASVGTQLRQKLLGIEQ
ncbi:shikimate dehydrogenase [Maritalea sp.]|uniref:shikimate dehydrogenase n=1 Tax=Maritalea sp. TaxID=2003361 RepID=UPI003EF3C10F